MNSVPLDQLLQVTAPRLDAAALPARPRDEASSFDNHFRKLRQESDTSPPASRTDRAPAPAATGESRRSTSERDSNAPAKTTPPPAATNDEAAAADTTDADSTADEPSADDTNREASDSSAAVAAIMTLPTGDEPPPQLAADAAAAAQLSEDDAVESLAPTAASLSRLPLPATSDTSLPVAATEPERSRAQASAEPENGATDDAAATTHTAARHTAHSSGPHTQEVPSPAAADAAENSSPESATAPRRAAVAIATTKLPAVGDGPKKSEKKSASPSATAAVAAVDPGSSAAAKDAAAPVAKASDTAPPVSTTVAPAAGDATAKPATEAAAGKEPVLSPLARLERGLAGTRHGQRANRSESTPHVDPARFISRVARAIETAQERGGPLQLRLSPPELGEMKLELTMNQGALTANIETDNSTTRQLLLDNLPTLRERLTEQNIKIERFDVDVRGDSSSSGQSKFGAENRGQQQAQEASRGAVGRRAAAPAAVAEPSAAVRRTITTSSINVVA